MNKKFLIAWLVLFVLYMAGGIVVHGVLLHAVYQATNLMRPEADAQKLMHESAWFGYMWFENGNFLVHKRIQGFPAGWGAMRYDEWWIDE